MIKQLKIAHKVYLLGTVMMTAILSIGILGMVNLIQIGDKLTLIEKTDIPLNQKLSHIEIYQLEYSLVVEQLISHSLLEVNTSKQISQLAKIEKKLNTEVDQTNNLLSVAKNATDDLEHLQVITELEQNLKKLPDILDTSFAQVNELKRALLQKNIDKISSLALSLTDLEQEVIELIDKKLQQVEKLTVSSSEAAKLSEEKALFQIALFTFVAFVIGIIAPHFIAKMITQPLSVFSATMRDISQGDGDLRVTLDDTRQDELGDVAKHFNNFTRVLRELLKKTNVEADTLGKSSETGLSLMQTTLQSVKQQHSETQQVATAVEQMTNTTREVAKSTANASQITEDVKSKVMEGKQVAEDTKSIVTQLSEQVSESTEVIQVLVSETSKIEGVLASIQGIAEQTNLLALNAAIEAARAGESGRGFAVVADEVRSLAKRTQVSTIDIQELINSLQKEAQNAINAMGKGKESAIICQDRAAQTANTFALAATSVEEISDINTQIATASEEQSAVSTEINNALISISDIANKTTEGTQKTSIANEEIAKSLINLHSQLNKFQI